MFTARKKIVKDKGEEPSELEDEVAKAFFELQEQAEAEMKVYLRDLVFSSAREVDVSANKKAIIIMVPFRLLKSYQKFQTRLVRELEKKFAGKIVVIVAQRKILPASAKSKKQMRPRSRTLTAVHDAILGDLVYPVDIVGRRMRMKTDGSKTLKILLDPKEQQSVEYKLEAFATVYKKMTGKDAVFEFPVVSE